MLTSTAPRKTRLNARTSARTLPRRALLSETFDQELPDNWSLLEGSASVADGILTLSSACVQLPGPAWRQYLRLRGLAVEARIRIHDNAAAFNIWGLYDRLANVPGNGPHNGYWTGWAPGDPDTSLHALWLTKDGARDNRLSVLSSRATLAAGEWYTVREEFTRHGFVRTYVDDRLTLALPDDHRQAGLVSIRSHGAVDVDWVRVSTLS